MDEKERLLKALRGEKIDRVPVICPGGMMNGCVTGLLDEKAGSHHETPAEMMLAAERVHDQAGFENLGVPFCMTVEAECFGAVIDMGSRFTEPRVKDYRNEAVSEFITGLSGEEKKQGRMPVIVETIGKLKNPSVPIIGNLTGPISTAASILDPLMVLKLLRKDAPLAEALFDEVTKELIRFGTDMIRAGADVITISDPTATGDILGPKNFNRFALPRYQQLIKELHEAGVPVILHICGDAQHLVEGLNETFADGVSVDSIVNLRQLKKELKPRMVGNVSTQLLHTGEPEKIRSIAKNCLDSGVDILAPACGLSMATPLENLRVLTDFVKEGSYHG